MYGVKRRFGKNNDWQWMTSHDPERNPELDLIVFETFREAQKYTESFTDLNFSIEPVSIKNHCRLVDTPADICQHCNCRKQWRKHE